MFHDCICDFLWWFFTQRLNICFVLSSYRYTLSHFAFGNVHLMYAFSLCVPCYFVSFDGWLAPFNFRMALFRWDVANFSFISPTPPLWCFGNSKVPSLRFCNDYYLPCLLIISLVVNPCSHVQLKMRLYYVPLTVLHGAPYITNLLPGGHHLQFTFT